jgi:hypothetical protein
LRVFSCNYRLLRKSGCAIGLINIFTRSNNENDLSATEMRYFRVSYHQKWPRTHESCQTTFEAAFHAHMAAWCLDGKPRTARQFAVYQNCPLPTPEDRLFFLLTYLKTYTLQVVQGRLFGMRQSKANQ